MAVESRRRTLRTADWILAAGLFIGVVALGTVLPHSLGASDEGLFLYEAKRVLQGEVMYRDIFEIITPASHYLMALLFAVFGTSIVTAKVSMAVLHALIVVSTYAACRTLRVGPPLAAAAAIAHVALGMQAWPYASPHWLSTLLTNLLLLVAIWRPWRTNPAKAAIPGFLIGLMVCVQQQKGAVMALGFCAVMLVDHAVERRFGERPSFAEVRRRFLFLILAALAVTLVVLGTTVARSGIEPMFRALIQHTLLNYRTLIHTTWGDIPPLTEYLARFTQPRILSLLPVVLPIAFLRALWDWLLVRRPEELYGQLVLLIVGTLSILSIYYFPDFIHISFIAPVFFVAAAEALQRATEGFARLASPLAVSPVVLAGCLVAALGWKIFDNTTRAWRDYNVSIETQFGRIDLGPGEPRPLIETVLRLARDQPGLELFCYPGYPALYLMTGAINPTPFQLLHPSYNDPDQLEQVTRILERRRVPFVVLIRAFLRGDDVVLDYLQQHYEPVGPETPSLYRRRPSSD